MLAKGIIDQFISKHKYLICYGAGKYGKTALEYFVKKNIKINAVIISDDVPFTSQSILGVRVCRVSELYFPKNECGIFITVSEEYCEEVIKNVLKKGFIHYLNIENNIYCCLRKKCLQEILERKRISIFNYKKLAAPFCYVNKENYFNTLYGHDRIFKRIFRKSMTKPLKCIIEHGPGRLINTILKEEVDADNRIGRVFYTSCKERVKVYQHYLPNKQVESVGLFMQYVKPIYSKEKEKEIKKSLGKVLLVFPYHSLPTVKSEFNVEKLIDEIEYRRRNFDTVLICLYWIDIFMNQYDRKFLRNGYKIVTAGFALDHNFLGRLRSIIQLSDMTMSNGIGSQLGYCVYLNKPHYIYFQTKNFYTKGEVEVEIKESQLAEINGPLLKKFDAADYESAENEIENCFGKYKEYITDEDRKIVKKYWGEWDESNK